jgi:KDO2-lipid IV(A) lauroyltransferase
MGRWLGRLAYHLSNDYRQHTQQHLRDALHYYQRDTDYSSCLHQTIDHMGMTLTEMPLLWFAPKAQLLKHIHITGWESVTTLQSQQRGILFLTPHLGAFELAGRYIAYQLPMTALYRPPRQLSLEALLLAGRTGQTLPAPDRPQLTLAPTTLGGVRQLARTLKQGGAIGILPDQTPRHGEGINVPFFGRPAYTMTLVAKLASLSHVGIVIVSAIRTPQGWHLHFEPLTLTPTQQQATTTATHAINQAIERVIMRHPEQYIWHYNRYKFNQPAEQ